MDVDPSTAGRYDYLYLFNEQCNGDGKTDYASALDHVGYLFCPLDRPWDTPIDSDLLVTMTPRGKTKLDITWTRLESACVVNVAGAFVILPSTGVSA